MEKDGKLAQLRLTLEARWGKRVIDYVTFEDGGKCWKWKDSKDMNLPSKEVEDLKETLSNSNVSFNFGKEKFVGWKQERGIQLEGGV